MTSVFKWAGLLSVAVLLSGCTSLEDHAELGRKARIYPGVGDDLKGLADCREAGPFAAVAVGYVVLDLPFSFVIDTLYLPADIYSACKSMQARDAVATHANNIPE